MTRLAAVDCGTNSIRLLVVETDDGPADGTGAGAASRPGGLRELDRRMRIVRLGEGVDRTRRLAPAALARTFTACEEFAAVLEELRPDRVRFVATSATRDAANAGEFAAGVRARLGVDPEVITGAEEAQLSFAGALAGLPADVAGPVLVVDIGGGSTEFVVGPTASAATRTAQQPAAIRGFSADVGCVRLTERHLHADPPRPAQVAAATADIDAAIGAARAAVPLAEVRSVVGVAGSVTTIAAAVLALAAYDSGRIDLARLPVTRVLASCDLLLHATRAERAALPYMHPGRADVIGAGALILARILAAVGSQLAVGELLVSEHDILDGIAMSIR